VVLVRGDTGPNHDQGEYHGYLTGKVMTDSSDGMYIGAEHGSNNTAELTAFYMALLFASNWPTESKITIYTDSEYAGNIADGTWRPSKNKAMVKELQKTWKLASGRQDLQWKHVRAHSNFHWNERADYLAYQVASGEAEITESQFSLEPLM
jgi:ribonuclease HI